MTNIPDHIREKQAQRSVDGFARSKEAEAKIDIAVREAMNTPNGKAVMDYLKSITINQVMPPSASSNELWMMEGMRRIVGILDMRRNSQPKE